MSAPLVDIRNCFRGCSDYVISVDGEERILGNYGALYDPQIGDEIDYVVDPTDPQWSVAVGESEYWVPNPTEDRIILLVLLAMALGASVWTVYKLLPEDLQSIFTKSPQPPSSFDSWGA